MGSAAALGAALTSPALAGTHTTLAALFASLPAPEAGDWVRLIMGLGGAAYQKQIGLGVEEAADGKLGFIETQIGSPGGVACNPNTLQKVYLRGPHFGSLLADYAVYAHVASSGNLLTRWADLGGGQTQNERDAQLRLLDVEALYDPRPCRIVSSSAAQIKADRAVYDTTHIVGEYAASTQAGRRLRRFELWSSPRVPFGVVKFRATLAELGEYELALFTHGRHFNSDLAMSLETLRALTPNGTSVQNT